MEHPERGRLAASSLALLLAGGTLICCALPILLVTLGLGAAVAALTASAPWLVGLSQWKGWIFALAGMALAVAGIVLFRPGRSCPADPELAYACARVDRWSRRICGTALVLWSVALFFAYAWLPLQVALD